METNSLPSKLYIHFRTYSDSKAALALAFVWGLAEATLFFIVPDVCLGLIALFNWRKGLLTTLCALAGAMIGGTIMYILGANNPTGMNHVLVSIPLIHINMVDLAYSQLQSAGLVMMVTGPKEGIPYKVFAVQSGILGLPLLQFVLMTIPARMIRFVIVVLLVGTIGVIFRKFIKKYPIVFVVTYAYVWLCIYIAYYLEFR
jgi:membrane protein YqaA with SNARE-associated domain